MGYMEPSCPTEQIQTAGANCQHGEMSCYRPRFKECAAPILGTINKRKCAESYYKEALAKQETKADFSSLNLKLAYILIQAGRIVNVNTKEVRRHASEALSNNPHQKE